MVLSLLGYQMGVPLYASECGYSCNVGLSQVADYTDRAAVVRAAMADSVKALRFGLRALEDRLARMQQLQDEDGAQLESRDLRLMAAVGAALGALDPTEAESCAICGEIENLEVKAEGVLFCSDEQACDARPARKGTWRLRRWRQMIL